MKNAIIAGSMCFAVLLGFYLLQQSNAIAQPPVTTRVVNASPQGEWVVVTAGYGEGTVGGASAVAANIVNIFDGDEYIVMVHTGTGKVRMVKWRDRDTQNPNPGFKVYDTP